FAVIAIAVNLSLAAVAAWGELGEPLVAVGCVVLLVILLWRLADALSAEEDPVSPEAQRSRLGLAILMVCLLMGVAGGLALAAIQVVKGFPSYKMVQAMLVVAGGPICVVTGIWLTVKVGLKQGMVWMLLLGGMVTAGYLTVDDAAALAEYPWGLTIVAGCWDFATALLVIAFKRELNNPWDPPSPDDRIRLAFLEICLQRMLQDTEQPAPLPAIEVVIPTAGGAGQRMLRFLDVPAVQLEKFAQHAIADTLAIDVTLPRGPFAQIRDQGLDAGMLVWRNKSVKKKVVATAYGKHVFRGIVEQLGS
ncbi:MAG: hypothetical protein ABIH46_07915, partial [Chloroflexota bacterium]